MNAFYLNEALDSIFKNFWFCSDFILYTSWENLVLDKEDSLVPISKNNMHEWVWNAYSFMHIIHAYYSCILCILYIFVWNIHICTIHGKAQLLRYANCTSLEIKSFKFTRVSKKTRGP